MSTTIDINQANPFKELSNVVNTINDIVRYTTRVEHVADNGIIISLPNNDSVLLEYSSIKAHATFHVNDEITVYRDSQNNIFYDNERYQLIQNIIINAKNNCVFNAEIIEATPKGLIVTIDGLQCFMPKGQIGDNLDTCIGNLVQVKLINIKLKEKEGNRFLPVVSHKALIDEKNVGLSQEKLDELKVGDMVSGVVKRIETYGVFVSIFPSIDGLIHITDLSWNRVSNPADIVTIGDHIDVVVLEKKQMKDGKFRISLGLKQLSQKPWDSFDKNSKEGDLVTGTICNITDYGVFIMLPCGVQGLVHKTELSWDAEITTKSFQKGDSITSKIINIDWEKEKLLLSIKQTQQDPWMNMIDKYAVGDIVDTSVINIKNFRLFVKVEQGMEGLIHVSELSWTDKIQKPQLIYNVGDRIRAIIINIDKDKRILELSHKRLQMDPLGNHQIGEHVTAIVVDTVKKGIHLKLENDDSPAFIPAHSISGGESFAAGTILNCVIKEINNDKRKIIVAIL